MKLFLCFLLFTIVQAQPLRIKSIQILDEGILDSNFTYLIDTKKTECPKNGDEIKNEKFYDTLVQLEVVNELPYSVMFTDFQIKLTNYNKKTFKSSKRALFGNLQAPAKGSVKFLGFLTKKTVNGKRLVNLKEEIPVNLGTRNIEYTLFYKLANKQSGKISAKSAARFAEINRCDR